VAQQDPLAMQQLLQQVQACWGTFLAQARTQLLQLLLVLVLALRHQLAQQGQRATQQLLQQVQACWGTSWGLARPRLLQLVQLVLVLSVGALQVLASHQAVLLLVLVLALALVMLQVLA
jgi:hypothetical protein